MSRILKFGRKIKKISYPQIKGCYFLRMWYACLWSDCISSELFSLHFLFLGKFGSWTPKFFVYFGFLYFNIGFKGGEGAFLAPPTFFLRVNFNLMLELKFELTETGLSYAVFVGRILQINCFLRTRVSQFSQQSPRKTWASY